MKLEGIDQGVGFGFTGCYEKSHPILHQLFRDIESWCPNLAASLQYRIGERDTIEELSLAEDSLHRDIKVINKVSRRAVINTTESFLSTITAYGVSHDDSFYKALESAYKEGYGVGSIADMANQDLRWFGKVSFTVK